MNLGVLQQYGTPAEVYNRPANTFVAHFMGSPAMNLLPCRLTEEGGRRLLDFGPSGRLPITDAALQRAAASARDGNLVLGIRPEHLDIAEAPAAGREGLLFHVDLLEPIGVRTIVHLRAGDAEVLAVKEKRFGRSLRGEVRALLPQERCHLFDAGSGVALGREVR